RHPGNDRPRADLRRPPASLSGPANPDRVARPSPRSGNADYDQGSNRARQGSGRITRAAPHPGGAAPDALLTPPARLLNIRRSSLPGTEPKAGRTGHASGRGIFSHTGGWGRGAGLGWRPGAAPLPDRAGAPRGPAAALRRDGQPAEPRPAAVPGVHP